MSGIHVLADTHLSADTPALNILLMQHLSEWMGKLDALYVLGNFFDVWLGDDIRHHVNEELTATLQAFSQHTPIYMQHGSHDFLLGEDFAARAGVTLLPEIATVTAYNQQLILLHGDVLYPHSEAEHAFRQRSRSAAWQAQQYQTPVPERKQTLAQQIWQQAHQPQAQQAIDESRLLALLDQHGSSHLYIRELPITVVHGHNPPAFTGRFEHVWQGMQVQRIALPRWQGFDGGYWHFTDQGQGQWQDLGVKIHAS